MISVKYCDNITKNCDTFKTIGTIINNTIIKQPFEEKYILTSTYNYNKIYNCVNTDTHTYDSLNNAEIDSSYSIGYTQNIFVYKKNKDSCTLSNHTYCPICWYLTLMSLCSLAIIICAMASCIKK